MENKKFNIFALVMIIVMAIFTIFNGINSGDSKDGRDGMSAYELAVSSGVFSGTEFEYLQSLHGKDGSNITLEDIYNAYLKEKNLTKDEYTFSQFILNFYPDELLDADETATAVQSATQSANPNFLPQTDACSSTTEKWVYCPPPRRQTQNVLYVSRATIVEKENSLPRSHTFSRRDCIRPATSNTA